jgi:hypothetical protein
MYVCMYLLMAIVSAILAHGSLAPLLWPSGEAKQQEARACGIGSCLLHGRQKAEEETKKGVRDKI